MAGAQGARGSGGAVETGSYNIPVSAEPHSCGKEFAFVPRAMHKL